MKFIYTTDLETKQELEKHLRLFQTYSSDKSTFWCFINDGTYNFSQQESLKFTMSDSLFF